MKLIIRETQKTDEPIGFLEELVDEIGGLILYIQEEEEDFEINILPCSDCEVDTGFTGIDEYYMVHHDLWVQVNGGEGFLCIGCLEERLGRELNANDFPAFPINDLTQHTERSARLVDRLSRVPVE